MRHVLVTWMKSSTIVSAQTTEQRLQLTPVARPACANSCAPWDPAASSDLFGMIAHSRGAAVASLCCGITSSGRPPKYTAATVPSLGVALFALNRFQLVLGFRPTPPADPHHAALRLCRPPRSPRSTPTRSEPTLPIEGMSWAARPTSLHLRAPVVFESASTNFVKRPLGGFLRRPRWAEYNSGGSRSHPAGAGSAAYSRAATVSSPLPPALPLQRTATAASPGARSSRCA